MIRLALLFSFIAIVVFCNVSAAVAQQPDSSPSAKAEYALPYPGILPDHPLYLLKRFRDRLLLFFTANSVKKSALHLLFADKKLAMSQKLWEQKTYDLSIQTVHEAEEHLVTSCMVLYDLKQAGGLPEGTMGKVNESSKKHREVITTYRVIVPDTKYDQQLESALFSTKRAEECIASL